MANRDPYRLHDFRCVPRETSIRRARHSGKREAQVAVIDAATEQDERYWVDLCYAEFFPDGASDAWWPMTDEDTVPTPGSLATLADALT